MATLSRSVEPLERGTDGAVHPRDRWVRGGELSRSGGLDDSAFRLPGPGCGATLRPHRNDRSNHSDPRALRVSTPRGRSAMDTMRAAVFRRYGPPEVLRVEEVAIPVPRRNEVRIRVRAAAVNVGDGEMRRSEIPNLIWLLVRIAFGLRRPRRPILGAYFYSKQLLHKCWC